MKRRRDRQKQRPFRASELGELHRPLDRRRRARDDDLTGAVVVRGLADRAGEVEVARRLRRDLHHRPEFEAEDRRHRAFAHRNRLLHRLAAQPQETRRVLESERFRGAKRRILAERMSGDIGRLPGSVEALLALENTQRRDARGHQRWLGVGGEREFGLGPLEHQLGKVL